MPYHRRQSIPPVLWVTVALALLLPAPTGAEFYRYTDSDGQVHYVDDPQHIPESQRDTMRVYEEGPPPDARRGQGRDDRRRREAVDATQKGERVDTAPVRVMESPVIIRGNRVLVPVEISYVGRKTKTLLLLDTGASFTILHQHAARQIMLTGRESRQAVVVGGSRIPIQIAEVDYIRVGPFKITNAQLAIVQHQGPAQEHQGLLGMDILRHLDYTLNIERSVIVWRR